MYNKCKLSKREMLKLYRSGKSLHDVGMIAGVTRERVRQIIADDPAYKSRELVGYRKLIDVAKEHGISRKALIKLAHLNNIQISVKRCTSVLSNIVLKEVKNKIISRPRCKCCGEYLVRFRKYKYGICSKCFIEIGYSIPEERERRNKSLLKSYYKYRDKRLKYSKWYQKNIWYPRKKLEKLNVKKDTRLLNQSEGAFR